MARVATPVDTAYPWYARLIFALQRRKYGAALESARLWGRLPRALLACGVGPEKLAALESFAASRLFAEREKAALSYAEEATDPRRQVDDACFARLRAQFDEQAIVELAALIAFQNMSSKFNAALAVPPQGLCKSLRHD